jgi:hypothetical protein
MIWDKSPSPDVDASPHRSNSTLGMHRDFTLALCATLLLCACASPTPPIAQGLPKTFGPTSDFDARIRQRFPVGSDEGRLISELRAENFAIAEIHDPSSQYRRMAHYQSHALACRETWTVRWASDQGQITGIEARNSGEICL